MIRFIFDLDGTLTAEESLPMLARRFGVEGIGRMTRSAVEGEEDYARNLNRRIEALGGIPSREAAAAIGSMALNEEIVKWIRANRESCVVATSNLDCWTAELRQRIPCQWFTSVARVSHDRTALERILDKALIVRKMRENGFVTVFIGDGANDCDAFRQADYAIGADFNGLGIRAVAEAADAVVSDPAQLVRELERLKRSDRRPRLRRGG